MVSTVHIKALFIAFLLLHSTQGVENPIKHLVVLMMENRSFDHLLGFLHLNDSRIDGLTGNEFNYYKADDPSSPKQTVNHNGFDEGPDDPGHSWTDTAEQIYGKIVAGPVHDDPKMNGFAQNALRIKHTPYNPFSMFDSTSAPVLNQLAVEYAVFDRWFCSVPGPTDPNRAFFMSGTSDGVITNFNGTLWGQQSYFDFLRQKGVTWRAYYQDDPWAVMYFKDMHTPANYQYVGELTQFFTDLQKGTLAQFTLLQPRASITNGPPTWQHPDASVAEGERLYKSIYEALRASPFWEQLAFVITYDEHGGFYDHVSPPQTGVPSPDGVVASNGFKFDRLGVRIPTVVVSPWVAKGTVVHEPTGPTSTSQYESTSIMATANKLFGVNDSLHGRSAWAGTFENLFLTLDAPRKDCLEKLADVPPYTQEQWDRQKALPLNDLLENQIMFYCQQNERGNGCGRGLVNQGQASDFIDGEVKYFWKRLYERNNVVQ